MSSIHDRIRNGKSEKGAVPRWIDLLAEHCPNVAGVFAGDPGQPPDRPAIAPMSIILIPKPDGLQFCLSRKGESGAWFGSVDDPKSLLLSLEAALAEGALTYSEKQQGSYRQKSGF